MNTTKAYVVLTLTLLSVAFMFPASSEAKLIHPVEDIENTDDAYERLLFIR